CSLVGHEANESVAADHRIGQQMHEAEKHDQRDCNNDYAPAMTNRYHCHPVAPAEPKLVAGEPHQCSRWAHAVAAGSATSIRKVSSKLAAVLPVRRCSSSSVPSAINRP